MNGFGCDIWKLNLVYGQDSTPIGY